MTDQLNKFVALLRGVNVGGSNKVPMADLRAVAKGLGWDQVKTYIASGNLVFAANEEPDDLAGRLRGALAKDLMVDVPIYVLPANVVRDITTACPFDDAGNRIHLFTCEAPPVLDDTLKNALIAPDEVIHIEGRFVWLYAPSGVARSKLFAKMEKVLGVAATARNLNTMRKLSDLVTTP